MNYVKMSLYQSFTPHKNHSEYFELDNDLSAVFIEILGLSKEYPPENLQKLENSDKTALEVLPFLSDLIVRDKGTYYMGARMGRPEKAKFKKLKHNIQVLFPLGHGTGRNIGEGKPIQKVIVLLTS